MTIWTDIQDKVTGYRKYSGGDTLTTQDGRALLARAEEEERFYQKHPPYPL